MIRWLVLCVFLCSLTAGVVLLGGMLLGQPPPQIPGFNDKPAVQPPQNNGNNGQATTPPVNPPATSTGSTMPGQIEVLKPDDSLFNPLIISNGRVQPIDRIDVPSEKDGKLILVATDRVNSDTPEDKKITLKHWVVAFQTNEEVPPEKRVTVLRGEKGAIYREWNESDNLPPNRLRVGYVWKTYRKLVEGDKVHKGELVAQVDPDLACDELETKLASIDMAESERETSKKTKEEAKTRYDRMINANIKSPGTFAQEDVAGAKLTWDRYIQEELAKGAALIKAQREANASITILNKHAIRAGVSGEIKVVYKHENEAVKTLDPVVQVENLDRLRVDGNVDVQDLNKLSKYSVVTVEPTTSSPPILTMNGHLQPVTCVAVSKGRLADGAKEPSFTIVSGSEDRTVIGWDSRSGRALWKLPIHTVVRALACTGEGAEHSLVLIGGADGSVRIVDLDKIQDKAEPLVLKHRHQSSVQCAAFSPDGKTCATSGDDRTIYLWDTETGELRTNGALERAHIAAVTSLQFATNDVLVSAGRDNNLIIWSVKADEPPHRIDSYDHRGGEVLQLGASPDGSQVLFDRGKELFILSLAKHKPEAVIQNYGTSANFTTMALFAPNGKTILTASAAENRLQLWRTPTKDGRAGELRQFITRGLSTCGAFAPNSKFAVTGTQDNHVLLWELPGEEEINERVTGIVVRIDRSLDAGAAQQVRIWVNVDNEEFKLTNKGLEALQAASVPAETLAKLKTWKRDWSLRNKEIEFENQDDFLKELGKRLTKPELEMWQAVLLRQADVTRYKIREETLESLRRESGVEDVVLAKLATLMGKPEFTREQFAAELEKTLSKDELEKLQADLFVDARADNILRKRMISGSIATIVVLPANP